MEYISKNKKRQAILTSVIYLLLIACGICFVWMRGIANLYPIYLVNIGVDLFGMLMGYVLFICCLIDVQKTGSDQRYFMYLLSVAYLGLFTDLAAWLVNGMPELRLINLIDNTLYYMCMPVGAYFFWLYVTKTLRSNTRLDLIIGRIMRIVLIVALLTIVINLFTGIYFTVDAAGEYHRSAWYPVSMVYAYLAMIATCVLIVARRKKLRAHQTAVLLIYVAAPLAVGIFSQAVYGLSISYGAIMLVLLMMYCVLNIDQGREKAAANRELGMAAQIQEAMLPDVFPAFPDRPEFDIYAAMDPAREVGGDFYDFFLIDRDHLCMVMADVSGKGIPAALFMMASKIILADNAMMEKSPAQILTDANAAICSNNRMEMFVTVWLGILEISTGKLTAANAGHEYPALKRADGGFELFKDTHGFVVGGMEGIRYREYELQLEPGAKLFLYTDGLPEATDAEGNMFGAERMLAALNGDADASSEQILDGVRKAVDGFVKDAEQFDDLTMLCVEYKGTGMLTDAFELEIEAAVENLPQVIEFVDRQLEKADCPMKTQMQIEVAVEEIFVNIASYAYAPDTGKAVVRMEFSDEPSAVTITFADQGVPYDPLKNEDPDMTLSAEEREIGGLGIWMTKKAMDDMSYEYKNGENILKLRKNLK